MNKLSSTLFLAALLLTVLITPARAGFVTFTNPTLFNEAIAGRTTSTQNFDGVEPGVINNGGSIGGLMFNYDFPTENTQLRVNNDGDAFSGTNYLGKITDGTVGDLQGTTNDVIVTPSGTTTAFGVYIVADPFVDAQLTLSVGGTSINNSATFFAPTGDGSLIFFLGIVEDTAANIGGSFTIELASSGDPLLDSIITDPLTFRIDDIVTAGSLTAVPEPTSLACCLLGTSLLLRVRRRNRK